MVNTSAISIRILRNYYIGVPHGTTQRPTSVTKTLQLGEKIGTHLRAHFALVFPRLGASILHAAHFGGVDRLRNDQQRGA